MGVIKTLAVGLGIITAGGAVAMAVPDVRNKTLDWLAPKSNIYKAQEKDLANTKESLENATKELEETKLTLTEKQSQVDTLTKEKTTLVGQVSNLQENIKQKDNQIETLNNQLTSTKQDLDTQTAYLETCQNKAIEIKSKIETLSQEDTQANALELSTLQTDLESIQAEVVKVENKINTLNATISSLNTNIATLTTEKQELQTSVTNLNSQISEKDTEIENLNDEITTLQDKVNELTNNRMSLNWVLYDVGASSYLALNKDTYCLSTVQQIQNVLNCENVLKSTNIQVVENGVVSYLNFSETVGKLTFGVFYINGVEKTQSEFSEYLSSVSTFAYIQSKCNLSSDYNLDIAIIDNAIQDASLTGKYVAEDGNYVDFDKGIVTCSFYKEKEMKLCLQGSMNNLSLSIPGAYSYKLNFISDTQIELDGKTYTKQS